MNTKINCRVFNTEDKGLLCFIYKDYSPIDLVETKNKFKARNTHFVFLDDYQVDDVVKLLDVFDFGSMITAGITCDSVYAVERLCRLYADKKIYACYVSIDNVYSFLDNHDIQFGLEKWKSSGEPGIVWPLDNTVNTAKAVVRLQHSIDKVILEIKKAKPQNEIETIIVFDAWLQRNIQYIKNKASKADGGYYICDEVTNEANCEDVLLHHYGRCEDIAGAAALVLNHPDIGIHCRLVVDEDACHSWNIITCEGKEYYTDFTHNITRNPDRYPQALKAMSYCPQFTLLGSDEANLNYCNTEVYPHEKMSKESYSRIQIEIVAKRLEDRGAVDLQWTDTPVKKSFFSKRRV